MLLLAGSCLAAAPVKAQSTADDASASNVKRSKKRVDDYRSRLGLKAGYNIAKVNGSTTNYSPESRKGFMIGGFFSPASKGLGYRTELVFSRQGFSFDENGKIQDVTQDYIYMPQLTTFTIARTLQLQAGAQFGYLLNAKKTSSGDPQTDVKEYMNRFDYGFAGGVEAYPFRGLLVGARYNVSMGSVYKQYESGGTSSVPMGYPFPFTPNDIKGKNAVVQFFVGLRF